MQVLIILSIIVFLQFRFNMLLFDKNFKIYFWRYIKSLKNYTVLLLFKKYKGDYRIKFFNQLLIFSFRFRGLYMVLVGQRSIFGFQGIRVVIVFLFIWDICVNSMLWVDEFLVFFVTLKWRLQDVWFQRFYSL